jgi:hypothetical protein
MYTIQSGTTVFCSGSEQMFIPAGGAHVRQCYLRIPFSFTSWPAITISIYSFSKDDPQTISGGTAFVPWGMEDAGSSPGETLIKVSAINTDYATPVKYPYVCSYVVAGQLGETTSML